MAKVITRHRGHTAGLYSLRRAVWGMLGVCLAAAIVLGLKTPQSGGSTGSGAGDGAVAVQLAPVQQRTVQRRVEVTGTLFGFEEATIAAKVKGRLRRNVVDVGDRLSPSQILAEIDPVDYQIAVQQRSAALDEALAKLGLTEIPDEKFALERVPTVERAALEAKNAALRLDRARRLFAEKPPLITEQDFSDIKTEFEVKQRDREVAILEARSQLALVSTRQSELAAATQSLADTVLRAPDHGPASSHSGGGGGASNSGVYAVAQRLRSPGEYIREGDPLFHLVWDNPLKFRGAVPERYLSQLAVGQRMDLTLEGFDQTFSGEVTRISPAIKVESRTFDVEVTVPNPKRALVAGAFVRGHIITGEESGRVIPEEAVLSFAGMERAFSVRDGKIVEHPIRIADFRDDTKGENVLYVVLSGLEEVTEVVVGNLSQLAAGQPVKVEQAAG